MITYNHFKWRNSPLALGAGRRDPHHLRYTLLQAGHHVSSLFSFSSGQKDHLILVVVAATTTIFTFRNNTSEQYQRNTDIIPKLFDIVPKVNIRFIRSALGAYFDFRPQKAIKIR